MSQKQLTIDRWEFLKQYTSARIAIGRAGGSLPTDEWLNFKLAHARARDAVHLDFDASSLAESLCNQDSRTVLVKTRARDRMSYLQRPDLGRLLDSESKAELARHHGEHDLAIILSDGLSSLAVERHAPELLEALLPRLHSANWAIAPLIVAPFARVALEDDVGEVLGAKIALILLGERPGLGSPDSLGAYLVFQPRAGNTDADRNCVSNIRPEGLNYGAAADTLDYLLIQARLRGISGVQLKDDRKLAESPSALPTADKMLEKR